MRTLAAWLGLLLPAAAAAQNSQVTGTVVDDLTSRPLNHVLVSLTMAAKEGGSVSALTESDGHFVFTDVPKGKYRLTAQRRGETPQGFHQDGGFTTAIAVGSGASTDNMIFPLRTNGAITGSVVDEQGEPVSGATVYLFIQSVVNGELQTNAARGANTNSTGEFHLGRLRAGTYFVAVSGRPWYSTSGQRTDEQFGGGTRQSANASRDTNTDVVYPVTWYGNTTNGEAASPIVVTEGATANIQVALRAAPSIHIQLPPSLGTSPTGFVGGANVFARGPGNVRVPLAAMFGFNGGDKVRELTGIPAGHYEVALRPPNPKEEGGLGATETLDLTDGMTLPLPSSSEFSVGGQVTFVAGDRPEKELEIYISGGGRSAMARISDDGTFSFPSDQLTAGSYIVHFNRAGVWIQSVTIKGGKRFGERLEIPASGTVVLSIVAATVDHLTKLEGFVTRDNAASGGATVLLMPLELGETKLIRRDQSDSDGSFTLSGVVPGRYTVIAIEDGSELLYKTASVVKPYIRGGVSITVPPQTGDVLKVPVQKRIVN